MGSPPDYDPTVPLENTREVLLGVMLEAFVGREHVVTVSGTPTTSDAFPTDGRIAKDTSTSPDTYYIGDGSAWQTAQTWLRLQASSAAPSGFHHKSADPGNQTYSSGTETTIATYDAGEHGVILPLNWNPADPTDADLNMVLRAEYHDGTTTDLITEAGGTEQTFENIVDGFATGDDGKAIRKLLVIVDETGGADATENIGATTTEFHVTPRGSGSVSVS